MKNRFYLPVFLLSLCCLPIPTTSIAGELPISDNFTAEYILQSGLFDIGKTKRTLSLQDDGRYAFTSTTKATGMFAMFFNGKITERSIWEFHEGRARPLQYDYKDTNKKKRYIFAYYVTYQYLSINVSATKIWIRQCLLRYRTWQML